MRNGQVAAIVAALVAALAVGVWLGGHPSRLPGLVRDALVADEVALNAEATEVIKDNYFRPVPPGELGDASIDGMVRSIRRRFEDRFSHYFSPENLARFRESITGRFSGVGLSVSEVQQGLRVGRVFSGTPASRAGIAVGDVIVSVNGRSIAGEDADIATAKIKGPKGTEVTVGVLRPRTGRTRPVRLRREEIEVPITTARVIEVAGRRLGYVSLLSFTEGAHAALRNAVERVEGRGAAGLLLDLRGNGGGLLEEAVLTSSVFLPEGEVVVSTRSRTQGKRVYEAVGGNLPPRPIVVLINRDTASAAEILASALADNGAATVVGTRSFGKGVFQQVIDLSNGGALDLTVGEFFTPDGVSLAGKGIRPDRRALDLPATGRDEGLRAALRALRGRLAAVEPG